MYYDGDVKWPFSLLVSILSTIVPIGQQGQQQFPKDSNHPQRTATIPKGQQSSTKDKDSNHPQRTAIVLKGQGHIP